MDLGSVQSLAYSLPEGILAIAVVLILMMEVLVRRKDMHGYWALLAAAGAGDTDELLEGGDLVRIPPERLRSVESIRRTSPGS